MLKNSIVNKNKIKIYKMKYLEIIKNAYLFSFNFSPMIVKKNK